MRPACVRSPNGVLLLDRRKAQLLPHETCITVLGVVSLLATTGISDTTVNDATGQDQSYFTGAVAPLVLLSFDKFAAPMI